MYCIPQCTFMLFHEAFLSSFGKILSAQQSIDKYLYHLAKTETIVTYVFISFYVIQNTYCLAYHLYLTHCFYYKWNSCLMTKLISDFSYRNDTVQFTVLYMPVLRKRVQLFLSGESLNL